MEWISVKDRLPTDEIECLVYPRKYHHTACFRPWKDKEGCYEANTFTVDDENGYEYEVCVTHWMPLPKSPKN